MALEALSSAQNGVCGIFGLENCSLKASSLRVDELVSEAQFMAIFAPGSAFELFGCLV